MHAAVRVEQQLFQTPVRYDSVGLWGVGELKIEHVQDKAPKKAEPFIKVDWKKL